MNFTLNYDGEVDIATGRNRRETHWKNAEILWSEFLSRIAETKRTDETLVEYTGFPKARQDEIKDVGGFVGGYINGGRRKSGNITHRQLLTLDIDHAKSDIWGDFTLLYGNAAALYSTHKHTPRNPRYRLLIPLDRPVGRDEYAAIGRRIAGLLGIENFDDTTYGPDRLMYWPSTSSDGQYVFEYQDGPWISADEVLSTYKDWRDSTQWPVSEKARSAVRSEIRKQGDPLEKTGVVGAFCRAHDIHAAIDIFLPDIYERCDTDPTRYTYREGSTAAGLVTYDDRYAYSHHGTDPVSGKLCNAFDLVRLHRFGAEDDRAKEGTPTNRLPSYVAMISFAVKDPETRKIIGQESFQNAAADFTESYPGEEEAPESSAPDWYGLLDLDNHGQLRGTIANYELILSEDPKLKGAFCYNEFRNTLEVLRPLPWRKAGDCSIWKDADDAGLRAYIEKNYETVSRSNLMDAVTNVFEKARKHPVREYLDTLEWDGIPRLDTLFVDYLGAEDCDYIRAVARKSFTAAVARIYRPGTKYDNVVVIVGRQGIGKSTLIRKMGREWFSDNFHAVQGKDSVEQILGVWLMEIGELAGLKKAEVEAIKSYISTQEDRCRLAYARRVESFPRQTVFFGTTNNRDFLRDPSGNRRFWPVDAEEHQPEKCVFDDLDEETIGQLWAEAVARFRNGEPLYLGRELEEYAQKHQRDHTEKDDRAGLIENFLDTPLPEKWADMQLHERRSYLAGDELVERGNVIRRRVCVAEIWCELFGRQQSDMNSYNTREIHTIMRSLPGWEESKAPIIIGPYGKQRVYRRKNDLPTNEPTNGN